MKLASILIRAAVPSAGRNDPYTVVVAGDPKIAEKVRNELDGNAISSYITRVPAEPGASYYELDMYTRRYWAEMAAETRGEVVPICMTGWDPRPRLERPMPWEIDKSGHSQRNGSCIAPPSGNELAQHFQAAFQFVRNNRSLCPERLVLAYAWDEYDEGGWLGPTQGDPNDNRLGRLRLGLVTRDCE